MVNMFTFAIFNDFGHFSIVKTEILEHTNTKCIEILNNRVIVSFPNNFTIPIKLTGPYKIDSISFPKLFHSLEILKNIHIYDDVMQQIILEKIVETLSESSVFIPHLPFINTRDHCDLLKRNEEEQNDIIRNYEIMRKTELINAQKNHEELANASIQDKLLRIRQLEQHVMLRRNN